MRRILYFIIVFQYVILWSCDQKQPINDLHNQQLYRLLNAEEQAIVKQIEFYEFNNLDKLRSNAEQLRVKKNLVAKQLGDYYLAKADYYEELTEENLSRILSFYEYFKQQDITGILYDIDILAYRYYYNLSNWEKANDYLEAAYLYIFETDFDLRRNSLVLGESPVFYPEDAKDRLQEIDIYLTDYDDSQWNQYIAKIYQGRAQANLILENYGDFEHYEKLVAQRSEEAGLYTIAATAYHQLAFHMEAEDNEEKQEVINYATKALTLAEQSGHKNLYTIHLRTLAHSYFNNNQFDKAYEYYGQSYKYIDKFGEEISKAYDLAYMGWAYYKWDPQNNVAKAIEYLDYAMQRAPKKHMAYRMAVERKLWIYKEEQMHEEAKATKELLSQFIIDHKEHEIDPLKDYHILNIFKFKSRQYLINHLKSKNELANTKLHHVKLLTLSGILVTIFMFMVIILLRRRLKMKLSLEDTKREVEKRNEHLKKQNQVIQKQNEKLITSRNQFKNELKSKLDLLDQSMRAINELSEVIKNHNKIDRLTKRDLLNAIDPSDNQRIIDNIDYQFIELNKEFCNLLSAKHPKLTNNNLKLCVYLRMNLSTKEISSLIYSTPDAVKVARSRLRKKLGLQKNQSLTQYLNSFNAEEQEQIQGHKILDEAK